MKKWIMIMTTVGLIWIQVDELKDWTPHYHIETETIQDTYSAPTGVGYYQVSGSINW